MSTLRRLVVCLFSVAIAVLGSGCLLTQSAYQRVDPVKPLVMGGLSMLPNQSVVIKAYNYKTKGWITLASAKSSSTPTLPKNFVPTAPALYGWNVTVNIKKQELWSDSWDFTCGPINCDPNPHDDIGCTATPLCTTGAYYRGEAALQITQPGSVPVYTFNDTACVQNKLLAGVDWTSALNACVAGAKDVTLASIYE